jgi:hypothetical protein
MSDLLDGRRNSRRRKFRWRRWFVAFVLLVVGVVAAAPWLVANSPLRQWVLLRAVSPQVGRLACGGARFSWTDEQTLTDVIFTNSQGETVVTAARVRLDRSLLALLSHPAELGRLVVTRPVAALVTRPDGSNLEDLYRAWAAFENSRAPDADSAAGMSSPTQWFELVVEEGAVHGLDQLTQQRWQLSQVQFTVGCRRATEIAQVAERTSPVVMWQGTGQSQVGLLNAQGVVAPGLLRFGLQTDPAGDMQLEVLADQVPLTPLQPWLARTLPGSQLVGAFSSELQIRWRPEASVVAETTAESVATSLSPSSPPTGQTAAETVWSAGATPCVIVGKAAIAGLRWQSPALAGDVLAISQGTCDLNLAVSDGTIQATRCALQADWLQAQLTGVLDISRFARNGWAMLPQTDAQLTAEFDLAQLTQMLPRALRLNPGVRIDAGTAEMTLQSVLLEGSRRWKAAVVVADLLGTDGARAIHWTDPVELGLALEHSPQGPLLERLLVSSQFAGATIQRRAPQGYAGRVECDLDRLTTQAGQLVDLSAWQLRGTAAGTFELTTWLPESFRGTAEFDLSGVDIRHQQRQVWADPQLRITVAARGNRRDWQVVRLDQAEVTLRGPQQSVDAKLLEPVECQGHASWLVDLQARGPLEAWNQRLGAWWTPVWQDVSGHAALSARIRADRSAVQVSASRIEVSDLRATIDRVVVAEPKVEVNGDLSYDFAAGDIVSQELSITSSTLAARCRAVEVRVDPARPLAIRGESAFRADLQRVAGWLGVPDQASGAWPRGQAKGHLVLATDGQRATGKLGIDCEPLEYVRRRAGKPGGRGEVDVLWREPALAFQSDATYLRDQDQLQLTNLQLAGETVQLGGNAVVQQLSTDRVVQAEVVARLDDTQVAQLVADYLGRGVSIQGLGEARIVASGRWKDASLASLTSTAPPATTDHWSRRWKMQTSTGFQSANAYGLPLGATQLAATLESGRLDFQPVQVPTTSGHFRLQPRVVFDPAPAQWMLPAGRIAEQVAISREVSESMLKYAAPILADATRAEGTFSVDLDRCVVPLAAPRDANAAGRLVIHQLSVNPGPMTEQLVTLVRQIAAVAEGGAAGALTPRSGRGLTAVDKTVDFQVVQQRVYHRGLEFLIDDVPVRSYGSVGMDDTLALVIEVPIQEKWVRRQKALQPLIGKMLEIPIRGTFDRPQIDERALATLSQQLLQGAAQQYLGDELNRALDRFLKPR